MKRAGVGRAGVKRAGLVGLALALTAGCGVPQDSEPRLIEPGDRPLTLPGSSPAPASDDLTTTALTSEQIELYFVRDGQAVPSVRATTRVMSLSALVDALLAGPTADELARGLASVVPSTLTVEDVTLENRTAVLQLGGPQDQVTSAQPLAYAQIVATLTASTRVDGVRFRLDDADLSVPRGDGALSEAPLDRRDYLDLISTDPA